MASSRIGSVIVVDDDPLIRLMTADGLTEHGFTVLEAADAEEALLILGKEGSRLHALFTDIHMPGDVDGLALAHHVDKHFPWLVLLITSGRARPGLHEMPTSARFLPKPYSSDKAAQHLEAMIKAIN